MKHLLLFLILGLPSLLIAQKDTIAVKTIKGITDRMIEIISVDVDEEVDWDAYRDLFLPTGQKITMNPNAPKGKQVKARNLEQFIREAGPSYSRNGFKEYAIGLDVNEFNGVANAFQSFYCKTLKGTYEKRGVNNYLLVYADDRWWIVATTFSNETDTSPLPDSMVDVEFRKRK